MFRRPHRFKCDSSNLSTGTQASRKEYSSSYNEGATYLSSSSQDFRQLTCPEFAVEGAFVNSMPTFDDSERSDNFNEARTNLDVHNPSVVELPSKYLACSVDTRARNEESVPRVPRVSVLNAETAGDDDVSPLICDNERLGATSTSSLISSPPAAEEVENVHTRTYKRRFWILFIFCVLTWFMCVEWNGWGPISESVFVAFPDWRSSTVAMMENWVSFLFVFCVLPVCWLTGRIGVRSGILISSFLFAAGLALRCITDKSPLFTVMCHICSILLGISMTLILSAPPMVAAVWFPLHERTTAVAMIMTAGQLGSVGSYLEPLFVREPSKTVPANLIKSDIMLLMYIVAGVGVILFLLIAIYFPSGPPLPPSFTSSTDRLNFKEGLLAIIRNKNFVLIVIIYGIASGPSLGWIGVLNFSLKPLGFTQDEAMFVGLVAVVACCMVTLITAKFTDLIYGYLKETIIVLLLAASLSYYWFLLLFENVLPFSRWQVFIAVSLGLSFNYASIPLFYAMAVEIAYPAQEILVGGVVTAFDSLSSSIFLFIYFVHSIGFGWVNYVLVASNAIPVLALLFITPRYGKAKLDIQESAAIL